MVDFWENLKINFIVYLIVKRGILAANEHWWNVSDLLLKDASGINYFYDLKKKYGNLVPINIGQTEVFLVTNVDTVRFILDNSPNLFSVGKLKYDMFKSFMKFNLGVSTGHMWKRRRKYNECVLNTNKHHVFIQHYNKYIKIILNNKIPKNFDDFNEIAKLLTMKIVFGINKIIPDIFDIFSEANSISSVYSSSTEIDERKLLILKGAIINSLKYDDGYSLIKLSKKCPFYSDNMFNELYHQVTHWIFPMVGLFSIHSIRILALISSAEILDDIKKNPLLIRKCILETFRLNNAVVSTFRTLTEDIEMDGKMFKKDDQFLILNSPILRDPEFWENPNTFNPYRWKEGMEISYYSMMFNQGPQKCPGKDLAIDLLYSFILNYLILTDFKVKVSPKININNVPQMINPYKFIFS